MKLSYTTEEIERWRNKIGGRRGRAASLSKEQALQFVNDVGYCLAFKSPTSELPSLWDATSSGQHNIRRKKAGRRTESLAREVKSDLLSQRRVFFGRFLQRRPTLLSLNYLPYFYVLQGGEGNEDDYLREFIKGKLTSDAKAIMDVLLHSSPQLTAELKQTLGIQRDVGSKRFERAIVELQSKLFVTQTGDRFDRSASSWASVYSCFASTVRKARKIQADTARVRILDKFFENQLISSVEDIQRVFAWNKQSIYRSLGTLVQTGTVTSNIKVDGRDSKYYCLVH